MITEEDVVLANQAFILEQCALFGRNLDSEERLSIAYEAFLYAIRSYQPFRSRFHPYAASVIARYMQEERTSCSRRMVLESKLSLDMSLGETADGPLMECFADEQSAFERGIILNDFLHMLPRTYQDIAAYLADGYMDSEICAHFQLEPAELSRCKTALQAFWLQYNQAAGR